MGARKIIWSKKTTEQLDEILTYYLERNGNNIFSSKLYKQIIKSTKILSKQPYLGKQSEDKNLRILNIDVYLIFYEILENHIEILIVWDGRRNPEELNKLLTN
jgi:plasmid stabilization system protein ParE